MSNTKLTSVQKDWLRNFREEQTKPMIHIFHFPEEGVTVGICQTGDIMGQFAVSICSRTETKFRKKVGEYNVRCAFDAGRCLPVIIGWRDIPTLAFDIARSIGR